MSSPKPGSIDFIASADSYDARVAQLTQRKAKLTEAQLAKLRERLNGVLSRGQSAQVSPRRYPGPAPLSFAQLRLWFMHQLEPDNPFYNESVCVELEGNLNERQLEAAIVRLVERHGILRTSFQEVDGEVRQVVGAASFALAIEPFSGSLDDLKVYATSIARRPMNLAIGPLFRGVLYKLNDRRSILVLTMHHVIADGWAIMLFVREMGLVYRELTAGTPARLPPLPLTYQDFATWQQDWAQGDEMHRQLAYWKSALADLAPLILPTDRPRPARQTYRGMRVVRTLSPDLTSRLRSFARERNVTLFMLLLAAYDVFLHRWTGGTDVAVGVPVANRHRPEIESILGFFVNTIVLRAHVATHTAFDDLLERVRDTVLDAQGNQDLPFERLVEELAPTRSNSQNPLFQVMFLLHDVLEQRQVLPDLQVIPLELDHLTAKFDLTLFVRDATDRLELMFEYSTELFDKSTIDRLLEKLELLLERCISSPEKSVGYHDVVGEPQQRLLLDFAAPSRQAPEPVHCRFETWAARTPDALALVFNGNALSYRELNQRSNQLAHLLINKGLQVDDAVALLLPRTELLLIAILGVLKAGGAYVPMDPKHPARRLEAILDAVRPKFTLCDQASGLPPPLTGELISLDGVTLSAQPVQDPERSIPDSARAYVIFTSGSTGNPKGVAVEQRQLAAYIAAFEERANTQLPMVAATVSTTTADLGHTVLFPTLASGGCVHLVPEELIADADGLAAYFGRNAIDFLKIVPSHFEALLSAAAPERLVPHRLLVFGGDRLPPELVQRVVTLNPACRIMNHYGPTETTVGVIAGDVRVRSGPVALGAPLLGNRTYVLDGALQLVAPGEQGELFVAGAQVARGYVGRPGLTAERFLPDLYGAPGDRMYRTGDVVRLKDGVYEFLGRVDRQVKLRGFRVELEEIQHLLVRHPWVSRAFVTTREDGDGTSHILAYAVHDVPQIAAAAESHADRVSSWKSVFENLYSASDDRADAQLNLTGWVDSFTGEQITRAAMEESVSQTVGRIVSLRPTTLLEIGCGVGLLAHRLVNSCQRYVGTDFSSQAIVYLRSQLSRSAAAKVELIVAGADELSSLARGSFDTVVLNSVVQYFPSGTYLSQVLSAAVDLIEDGGHLFIGDVRSLPLLRAFCAALELSRAGDDLPISELRARVARAAELEEELAVDPQFFLAFARANARIRRLWVEPKCGAYDNELTRYRYDVFLEIGPREAEHPLGVRLEKCPAWSAQSLDSLRTELTSARPHVFGLRGVPNARLAQDRILLSALEADPPAATSVGALRQWLSTRENAGMTPESVRHLGESLGYRVDLSWLTHDESGAFDVLLTSAHASPDVVPRGALDSYVRPPPLTNTPLQSTLVLRLPAVLRKHLEESLPDYMVPRSIVTLSDLPLTKNGKVDTAKLPVPALFDPSAGGYVAPRDPIEELLAEVWAEVLGVPRVGVFDDFFALGGHSLLATQVVSRVRKVFQIELPLRELFEATTVASLARLVARAKSGQTSPLAPIGAGPRAAAYPLSYAQERFWFLGQMHPGNAAYNLYYYCRLRGNLNFAVLKRAFGEIIRRHSVLRSRWRPVAGEPAMLVLEDAEFELPLVDLRGRENVQEEVKRIATEEAQRAFNLPEEPPLRVKLLRLSELEHVALATIHHIASDAWSRNQFVSELATLYSAFLANQPTPLDDLPIQYSDYARWQREWLAGGAMQTQLDWWLEALAGAPTRLELGSRQPRPEQPSFHGHVLRVLLSAENGAALRRLARSQGATLYMAILAVWGAVLSRFSGQEELVVGSPIAGRTRIELEPLIGFFANSLALRIDGRGDPSFLELLIRVRDFCLGAYAHQDLPFEKLVEALRPEADASRHPIFQTMFVFQNVPTAEVVATDLRVTPLNFHSGRTMFDLTLVLSEQSDEISGVLEYCTDVLTDESARAIGEAFERFAEFVARHESVALSQVPILSPGEEQWLSYGVNATRRSRQDRDFYSAIHRQLCSASGTAITTSSEAISYGELRVRVARLAERLERVGAGPEARVALCMPRSADLVVSILAVLHVGAAFVAIDPSYPLARKRWIAEDSGARVVLSDETCSNDFGTLSVLSPSESNEAVLSTKEARLPEPLPLSPEALAYVMYTSGTTGRPKGVAVSRGALSNLIFWFRDAEWLHARSVVMLKTPVTFDAALWEIFGPLICGAELVVAPAGAHADPAQLVTSIQQHCVSALQLVPSMLRLVLEVPGLGQRAASLTDVFVGGESLTRDLAQRFYQAFPRAVRLHNQYGPTEATVDASCSTVAADAEVRIGRPISNTQLYVLGTNLELLPAGVTGELCVGGEGLARGYWRAPALTAKSFVPNPHGEAGSRLYKTGDLARLHSDGQFEFVGRRDGQLKLGGQRLELEEVRAALLRVERVCNAAVRPVPNAESAERLVAYLQPASGETLEVSDVRHAISLWLPSYMVPSAFVCVESLPTTFHGKLDVRALPLPEELMEERKVIGARSEVEFALLGICSELVPARPISMDDDFFVRLGGHSLLALRLLARIEATFGAEIALHDFYREPTLQAVARRLGALEIRPRRPLVKLQTEGRLTPLILIHPIDGGVGCYYDLAQELLGDRPVIALQAIDETLGKSPSVEVLARSYAQELRSYQETGPYLVGGWSLGAVLAYAVAVELCALGEQVEAVVLLDRPARGVVNVAEFVGTALGLSGEGAFEQALAEAAQGTPADLAASVLAILRDAGRPLRPGEDSVLTRGIERVLPLSRAVNAYAIPQSSLDLVVVAATDRAVAPDPSLGWAKMTCGKVEVRSSPGSHHSMLRKPNARCLAESLREVLSGHVSGTAVVPPVASLPLPGGSG